MDSCLETVKIGFGDLGKVFLGDERRDGLEGSEGFIGVFLMESFRSI
jgi:hypothetical protein